MARKNKYYPFILPEDRENGKKGGRILSSWDECQKEKKLVLEKWNALEEYKDLKKKPPLREIACGFPTEEEAKAFIDGTWRRKSISKEAKAWLEAYLAKPVQLQPDTELDISAFASGEHLQYYDKYCAYVDGSYNDQTDTYGFGVAFFLDGKIVKLYGSGKEAALVRSRNDTGELLACMEAIKYAKTLNLPELTIVYDAEVIHWADFDRGDKILSQAAGQYINDTKATMGIKIKSIMGRAHEADKPVIRKKLSPAELADADANSLADKLAKKGAGI